MQLTSFGAAEEVTGSCHLIETGDSRVLLDCGLIQGRASEAERNHEPFPFDPASLDAVVLSHAHIDHSGRLPMLIRQGFAGRIHTHAASAELLAIMLADSARLNARDVERRNRRRARKGKAPLDPLYTEDDVHVCLRRLVNERYGESFHPADGVHVRLHDAGHIIGSAIVELTLNEGDAERTVVFSGDLGHRGAPILNDFTRLHAADLVLMESTYGDHLHRDWSATAEEVKSIAEAVSKTRGNVLIPAFAVGRSQMILYAMARNFNAWALDDWQIFLDSPMAIEATEVYLRHTALYDSEAATFYRQRGASLGLHNLRFSRTAEESMRINRIHSGAIVIAGSGMCTGGRILHHLKHNVWRPETQVIIAGYQSPGTPGRDLVDGRDHIRIWGEDIRVAAEIHTIGGLSAHADQQGLLDWYAGFDGRPPCVLVHGENGPMAALAKRMRGELGARARPARAGESIDLLNLDTFGQQL